MPGNPAIGAGAASPSDPETAAVAAIDNQHQRSGERGYSGRL
jgi:hypothetical protein